MKSGDDCRQELLALQLIREFGEIWAAAGLPLWVYPFEVLVTSNNTALIELIPDATSIHSIKARSSSSSVAAVAKKPGTPQPVPGAGSSSSSSGGGGNTGSISLSNHFFCQVAAGQRCVHCCSEEVRGEPGRLQPDYVSVTGG